jgi:hypothetical protein
VAVGADWKRVSSAPLISMCRSSRRGRTVEGLAAQNFLPVLRFDQRLVSESRGAGSGRRFVLPFPLQSIAMRARQADRWFRS